METHLNSKKSVENEVNLSQDYKSNDVLCTNSEFHLNSFLQTPLDDDAEEEYFFIINPNNGTLEDAEVQSVIENDLEIYHQEDSDQIPTKKSRKNLSLYEETLLRTFNAEIEKERSLLAEEHDMKMKLWDLEMEASRKEHTLKMAILKEKLEKIRKESEDIQRLRKSKFSAEFRSGPI